VVSGGTLSGTGLRGAGTTTLADLTLSPAAVLEVGHGDSVKLSGTVDNQGIIKLNDTGTGYAYLYPSGSAVLSGNGRVQFSANGSTAGQYIDYLSSSDLLTIGAEQVVETTGPSSYGWIYTKLLNHGAIEANGGFLDLLGLSKTNEGRFLSRAGRPVSHPIDIDQLRFRGRYAHRRKLRGFKQLARWTSARTVPSSSTRPTSRSAGGFGFYGH